MSRLLATFALLLAAGAACTTGAGDPPAKADGGPVQAPLEAPALGACRVLTPQDTARQDNATETVDCGDPHTAETFTVGTFPTSVSGRGYRSRALGRFIYEECGRRFARFVGGNESMVLRSLVSWAWFRPTQSAWSQGARWYRCDIVGGTERATTYRDLPTTAKNLLGGKPDDRWLACVDGSSVTGSEKIPCTEQHTWRAVTTIKLGDDKDRYPGDRLVEVRSRDFCSDSVGAWLNYPLGYSFGYTWFHEAEWRAGNRRSICWAKTDQ